MTDTKEKRCIPSIIVILACIGLVTTTFIVSTGIGYFRVNIENVKARTVWVFNAPSAENISISPADFKCLKEKECEFLPDGTIKISKAEEQQMRKEIEKEVNKTKGGKATNERSN